MFIVMLTWLGGRKVFLERHQNADVQLKPFLDLLFRKPPPRAPGTAVFLTATPDFVPHALVHNLNHNNVLHERVVFLTVTMKDVPWVPLSDSGSVESLGHDCYRKTLHFGFVNQPDVPMALARLHWKSGMEFDMMRSSFFPSRETVIPVANIPNGMAPWRERLFATMTRNARQSGRILQHPAKSRDRNWRTNPNIDE